MSEFCGAKIWCILERHHHGECRPEQFSKNAQPKEQQEGQAKLEQAMDLVRAHLGGLFYSVIQGRIEELEAGRVEYESEIKRFHEHLTRNLNGECICPHRTGSASHFPGCPKAVNGITISRSKLINRIEVYLKMREEEIKALQVEPDIAVPLLEIDQELLTEALAALEQN